MTVMLPTRPRTIKRVSVEAILQWAFGVEHATVLTEDDRPMVWGRDAIAVIADAGMMGCTIDYSGGHWRRHDDADAVTEAMRGLSPQAQILIAQHARARSRPDPMIGARPWPEPALGWRHNRYQEAIGVSESLRRLVATTRRGRKIEVDIRWTPIVWRPTLAQIDAARRQWSAWRAALWHVRNRLRSEGGLRDHRVTEALPPVAPWEGPEA